MPLELYTLFHSCRNLLLFWVVHCPIAYECIRLYYTLEHCLIIRISHVRTHGFSVRKATDSLLFKLGHFKVKGQKRTE